MQVYEAKNIAMSVAANLSVDEPAPVRAAISAAITYLCGKTERTSFIKKCAKSPLYARMIMLCENTPADFGSESFCSAHKTLFDQNPNSGELRTTELSLPGGSCADPKLLKGSLKNVLTKLQEIGSAPAVNKADFAAQLCCYIRELIILSPFAYGNGIVRRAFIQNFCHNRGFMLNYAAAGKNEIVSAELESFASDAPGPLFSLLVKCLNYLQDESAAQHKVPRRLAQKATAATRHEIARTHRPELGSSPERKVSQPPQNKPPEPPSATKAEQKRPDKPEPPKRPSAAQEPPKRPSTMPEPQKSAAKSEQKPSDNAEILRELRDVKRSLESLTAHVNDLIRSLTDKQ